MKVKAYKIFFVSGIAVVIVALIFKSIILPKIQKFGFEDQCHDIIEIAFSETETSQIDLFFPLEREFNWASFEKQNKNVTSSFLKNLPERLIYYIENYNWSLPMIEEHIHIMDFNNDGLDDVIFQGYLYEPSPIVIYINTGKDFEEIFWGHSFFHKLEFEDGRVHKLYVYEYGCCCEEVERQKIYTVDYTSELPKINLVSQSLFIYPRMEQYREFPNYYFEKPRKFEFLNEMYDIRLTTAVNDTMAWFFICEERIGNSLGKVKSGSVGYALSEKIDSLGRVWWYVAVCPGAEIYESSFHPMLRRHSPYTYEESYKLGWILICRI